MTKKLIVDAGDIESKIEKLGKSTYVVWVPPLEEQLNELYGEWSNPESNGIGTLFYDECQIGTGPRILEFFLNPKK